MHPVYALSLICLAVVAGSFAEDRLRNDTVQGPPPVATDSAPTAGSPTLGPERAGGTGTNSSQQADSDPLAHLKVLVGLHLCHYAFFSFLELCTLFSYENCGDMVSSADTRWLLLLLFSAVWDPVFFVLSGFGVIPDILRNAVYANYAVLVELGWILATECYTSYRLLDGAGLVALSGIRVRLKDVRPLAARRMPLKLGYLFFVLWPASFVLLSSHFPVPSDSRGMFRSLQHCLLPAASQVALLCLLAVLYDVGVRRHATKEDQWVSRFGVRFAFYAHATMLFAGSVFAQLLALASDSVASLLVCGIVHVGSLILYFSVKRREAQKRLASKQSTPAAEPAGAENPC